ncbi:hypothetical protein EJB05_37148 [Eragrostis curvula]|uniref:Uncharacterized protein n=1 Tax=Eragrostis curvula TaxID=38414 RepID=A0A5J9TR46_9POAL|nr:hypothetical protein EJB05_37148 [Eragrostis curvula]
MRARRVFWVSQRDGQTIAADVFGLVAVLKLGSSLMVGQSGVEASRAMEDMILSRFSIHLLPDLTPSIGHT